MTAPAKPYDEITDAPYLECPRFERCSVNHCLLDPLRVACERESIPGDPETRCTLPKRRRMAIAARHPELLPDRGLRPRELAAMQRWEALTPEQRERLAERGRAALAALAARTEDAA
jgi:hypothetical protein